MSSQHHLHGRLEITLQEDLHSGTGTGGSTLDAIQIRDRNGQPVIRASHLKGLLRDTAVELEKLGLTSINQINPLFGNRGGWKRGALLLQSLRLAEPTDCMTWTSTAREDNNRIPQEDTLNTIEYVPAGTHFKAELELRRPELKDLLERCIRRLLKLGSRRSRGAGLILTKLTFPADEEANTTQPLPSPTDNQLRLRLVLCNLDPLSLPVTGFPGNIIDSECYIRGQRLLGALMGWAISHDQRDLNQLRDQVKVGNALPVPVNVTNLTAQTDSSHWDVSPIPLSIQTPKPSGQKNPAWPWWAQPQNPLNHLGDSYETDNLHSVNDELRAEKPKRPGDSEFLFQGDSITGWRRYKPVINLHMRNQVPNKHDRDAQLFAVEEIAEDTLFLANLEFQNLNAARQFATDFESVLQGKDWLAVGRGGCPVKIMSYCWLELPAHAPATGTDNFTLTLQSDLLARSPQLGFYDALDPWMLAKLVGLNTTGKETWKFQSVSETVEVRGFNALSGLPRLPLLAIRRGSTIHIQGSGSQELRTHLVARTQLGERGSEGFGRFRLDFKPMNVKAKATDKPTPLPEVNIEVGEQETLLETVFALEEKLKQARQQAEKEHKKAPGKSQWQYLREQALIAKNRENLDKVIADLKKHADKLGGSAWNYACLDKIEKCIADKKLEDARQFIDLLVRRHWTRTLANEEETSA